jgi:hypothetical protein
MCVVGVVGETAGPGRVVQGAAGQPAPIVGDDRVIGDEVVDQVDAAVGVTFAALRDQQHRPGAADLVVDGGAQNGQPAGRGGLGGHRSSGCRWSDRTGRTLMKIGEEAIPTDGIGEYSTRHRSVLIVAVDIRAHPDSSVGEIAERTGFAQSKVSGCIARLREAGAINTTTDPHDRRRLLVRPYRAHPNASHRSVRPPSTPPSPPRSAATT